MYRLHQGIAALVKFQFQFSFQGKDDLRQDAVMQQVFTLLNTLLKNNKETQNAIQHNMQYGHINNILKISNHFCSSITSKFHFTTFTYV